MEYRTWGAARQVTYGNGAQVDLTYDERLRPTRYELSDVHYPGSTAATMGTENEYAADGRIRYARDLQDGNFDRAYDYDQAGRLKKLLRAARRVACRL